jgi:dTDP-4-amino-4,6-dideoxygalactose transaminase
LTQSLLAAAASGWYVLGEAVNRFEEAWADYLDVPWAVGVSNGLDGLHIALRALGVGKGDEVIVPSNTYIATWLAVTFTGARPIPAEPDPQTMVLDAAGIEAALSERTKAVIPVHLYGHPCNMPEIMRLAQERGLFVVEDNAQAQGAAWRGQKTGTFGHLNATSLYPGKNLGALGDAGILSGTDERYRQHARRLRNYGSTRKYYNEEYGFNARLDELQAAVLLPLLQLLDAQNERRREIAGRYSAALAGAGDLELPTAAPGATHVWHQYVVRSHHREDLMYFLQQQGVGILLHYPVPPHLQQAYRRLGYRAGDFPVAEDIANRCLSLPIDPTLSDPAIDRVAELIHDFFA